MANTDPWHSRTSRAPQSILDHSKSLSNTQTSRTSMPVSLAQSVTAAWTVGGHPSLNEVWVHNDFADDRVIL
jgi:hypothetical protein